MSTCSSSCTCTCSCNPKSKATTLTSIGNYYYNEKFVSLFMFSGIVVFFSSFISAASIFSGNVSLVIKMIPFVVTAILFILFFVSYGDLYLKYKVNDRNNTVVTSDLAEWIARNKDIDKEKKHLLAAHIMSGKVLRMKHLYEIDAVIESKRIAAEQKETAGYEKIICFFDADKTSSCAVLPKEKNNV